MRFIPVFLLLAILYLSCGKDSFTTTPQLKYKSANRTTISNEQVLELKFRLTDQEGDFSSFLGMRKVVSNGCVGSEVYDSASFGIPDEFIKTKLTEGEVVVSITRFKRGPNTCSTPGGGTRPDTSVFKFWTRDRAGHTSDSAVTEPIIILN